jgi:flagellar biosynthesis protein FliQ
MEFAAGFFGVVIRHLADITAPGHFTSIPSSLSQPQFESIQMDATQVLATGQQGLTMLLMVSAPVLLVVLVVGLLISIFQAATQINETTLSFVPKVLATVAVLVVAGPWMVTTLVEYIQRSLQAIPGAVG